jgi:uncharacterized phage-associated protein
MTKIIKLTYIAYGTCLAMHDHRLVDEHPRAWPSGPVFPKLRKRLLRLDHNDVRMTDRRLKSIRKDKDVESLVKSIYKFFGKYSDHMLCEWTKMCGSPWDIVVLEWEPEWGKKINDGVIRKYFDRAVTIRDKEKVEHVY